MTQAEDIAMVLIGLVNAMADDMLTGRDSGLEDSYTIFVAQLTQLTQSEEEESY